MKKKTYIALAAFTAVTAASLTANAWYWAPKEENRKEEAPVAALSVGPVADVGGISVDLTCDEIVNQHEETIEDLRWEIRRLTPGTCENYCFGNSARGTVNRRRHDASCVSQCEEEAMLSALSSLRDAQSDRNEEIIRILSSR